MKISKMIEALEEAKKDCGDIECLIEVEYDYVTCTLPCNDLIYDVREGYGESVLFSE